MDYRQLGTGGRRVSKIGLGCMGTRVEENAAAAALHLTPQEIAEIESAAPKGVAAGERYPAAATGSVNR